jgi:hypothetical protein
MRRNARKVLQGNSEEKGPLIRSRCRWKNNIKTVSKEIKGKDIPVTGRGGP